MFFHQNYILFYFNRFLATGATFRSLAFQFRMGKSTIAAIVAETCKEIWNILQPIYMPAPTEKLCLEAAAAYGNKWNFPNCWGAIDGKHVRIKCPAKSGSMYYNYKQFFSLILQAVSDANCKFLCIDVGAYGKQSDGGVFRGSDLFNCLTSNKLGSNVQNKIPHTDLKLPLVLVGDEADPLLPYLMRPFPRNNLDRSKRIFNYRLSQAQRSIECSYLNNMFT